MDRALLLLRLVGAGGGEVVFGCWLPPLSLLSMVLSQLRRETETETDGERESRSPFLPPLLPFLFAPFFPAEGGREGATDSSAPPPPPPAPATTVPLQLNARGPHGREASEARQSPIHRQASPFLPTPPEAITPNSHSPFPFFVSPHFFASAAGYSFTSRYNNSKEKGGGRRRGGGKKECSSGSVIAAFVVYETEHFYIPHFEVESWMERKAVS